jgi:predicted dinucleotide-binding enzyme
MTVVGIIGAGEVGSQIARAAVANGYDVVIANSRGPETLKDLIRRGARLRSGRVGLAGWLVVDYRMAARSETRPAMAW